MGRAEGGRDDRAGGADRPAYDPDRSGGRPEAGATVEILVPAPIIAPAVIPAGIGVSISVVMIGHAPPVIAASVGISRSRDLAVGIRIGRAIAAVVDDVLCQRGTRHCRGEDYSGAK